MCQLLSVVELPSKTLRTQQGMCVYVMCVCDVCVCVYTPVCWIYLDWLSYSFNPHKIIYCYSEQTYLFGKMASLNVKLVNFIFSVL